MSEKIEFIESYIKVQGGDYQWSDNHGELVRCKDCKLKGNINLCPLAYIEKTEQFTALCTDEWFCGNGKRKQ